MQTIYLDANSYKTSAALHTALKSMLSLPDYYGMNADALNDCLGEKAETVNLWILRPGEEETAVAVRRIAAVIRDNGGVVKELESL